MPRSFGTTNAAPYATAPAVGAAGDTYFNTTSKTLYLSDGTSWIQVQGSGGAAGVAYGARLRRNVDQAFTGTTTTVVMTTLMAEVTPGETWNHPASGGMKVPVGAGGRYFLSAHCRWEAGQVANSALIIFVNSVPIVRDAPGQPSTQYFEQHCAVAWTLNDGDVITLGANQNAGVSRNMSAVWPAAGTDPGGPILEAWKIDSKGDKGDTGPVGPDIAAAQSSYWLGTVGGSAATAGATVALTTTTTATTGFTLNGTTAVRCSQTGRYVVHAEFSFPNTTASVITTIRQLRGISTVRECVVRGNTVPASAWGQTSALGIFDLLAGDDVQLLVNPQTAGIVVDANYSQMTILPVGGTKGDTGEIGPPGGMQSGVRRRHSVNQTVGQNVQTTLALDTQVDLLGAETWAYNTTTRQITVPSNGLYIVSCQIQGESQTWASTAVYGSIRINGVDVALGYPSGSAYDVIGLTATLPLNAGDLVSLTLYQNVAASSTVRGQASGGGAPISPMLSIWRMGSGEKGTKGDKGDTGPPLPSGGTTGQMLTKKSNTDLDAQWSDNPGGTSKVMQYRRGNKAPVAVGTIAVDMFSLYNVTLVANHLYRLTVSLRAMHTNTNWDGYIRINTTGSIMTQFDNYYKGGTAYGNVTAIAIFSGYAITNGYIIVQVSSNIAGCQVWNDQQGFALLEDLGLDPGSSGVN